MKSEAEGLTNALAAYPDLRIHEDRWRRKRYVTAAVNGRVTDCDISHNCGCCEDSCLEVWPYLATDDGMKLFASGVPYRPGQRCDGGELPFENWQDEFRANGINETIVEKVAAFFASHLPSEPSDDDE